MKKKLLLILIFCLLLGLFLRIYNFYNSFSFSGEFGDNLLDIKNAITERKIPLIGAPTSHPWLNFGPLYFWVMTPLLIFFRFNPMVGAWFGAFTGISAILINYFVIKEIKNDKVALLSSFLMAVSPLWVCFSRDARFFFIVTLVFYLFLYCLWNLYNNNKSYFLLGFSYSLFFHFHFSPILLFPVLACFLFVKRKKIVIKQWLQITFGFSVPLLPVLIFDLRNGFSMLSKFVLWIPYRFAGFFGLYPKNNPSLNTFKQILHASEEFIGKSFIFAEDIWFWIFISFFIFFLISFLKYLKNKTFNFFHSFIYLSFLFAIFGIFVHGDVPVHYFLPVFPVPILFVSDQLLVLYKKSSLFFQKALLGIVFLIMLLNSLFLINYYSGFDKKTFRLEPSFVSLDLQKEITEYIVNDSNGQKYTLIRVGPNDYFEEYYSQNYKYLLWLNGNEPVNDSNLSYTIYEKFDNNILDISEIEYFGKIGVTKNEK